MMLPRERLTKMKTFKDKDPLGSELDKSVIDGFCEQQLQTMDLITSAANVSLNRTRVPMSISRLIKLKLGDAFRVLIYHNQRHLEQVLRIIEEIKKDHTPSPGM